MAKAAIGQICSSNSMAHNLAQCVKLVSQAAGAGAKILFLPEASDYIGTSAQESLALARPVASSPFVTGLQAAAAQHSIAVHVGIHVPVAVKPASCATPSPSLSSSSQTMGSTGDNRASNPVLTSTPQSEDVVAVAPSTSSTNNKNNREETTTTKLYNRTIYITPKGDILASASYNKLHLFDYSTLRESASTQAGTQLIPPIASPIGRLGSLICFDLRFAEPALYLTTRSHFPSPSPSLSSRTENEKKNREEEEEDMIPSNNETGPAQILLYPSAFTVPTGRAHWEVLLRARAIETQSYVIAAAQVGAHNYDHHHHPSTTTTTPPTPTSTSTPTTPETKKRPRISYGHSMVVDPWGRVILEMKGVRPGWDLENDEVEDAIEDGAVGQLGIVDIDLGEWERVRERMPLIRRTDVYPEI